MSNSADRKSRLRYYGRGDYATYFQVEHAFELLHNFDPAKALTDVNDVIELHHAALFVENDFYPNGASEDAKAEARSKLADVKRVVGSFFQSVNETTVGSLIVDVDHQFYDDVLDMLGRSKAYERCSATVMLPALRDANIHTRNLLGCRALVRAYDDEIRSLLMASPENAEHLITEHLLPDDRHKIVLPAGLTPADRRSLLDSYIDSGTANPNYLKLLATARKNLSLGISDLLKLKAQKAYDAYWKTQFESNVGIKTGVEVRIDDEQVEAVTAKLDGLVGKHSYSRSWLKDNLDFPTVLNNFILLFEFANAHMLLNFPSFYSQLGVFERLVVTVGRDDYRTGASFDHQHQAAVLQTLMYDQFLRGQEVELEAAIEWFFTEYLPEEFGAENFRFRPSSPSATFLEKSRHLFSEMESVLKQFTLYAENGEVDMDLLALASDQLSYQNIPSLLGDQKYVYVSDNPDIQTIQNLLFSDQAMLGYINEDMKGNTFAELMDKHDVMYDGFEEHQRPELDFLIDKGIIRHEPGKPLAYASNAQFLVLRMLNAFEAANVQHFSPGARATIDEMKSKGWLTSGSTLLTHAESNYFNYMLNSTYSNGLQLRNRYIHGSQADGDDKQVHLQTYIEVLRLLIALVIKINDDFELRYPPTPDPE